MVAHVLRPNFLRKHPWAVPAVCRILLSSSTCLPAVLLITLGLGTQTCETHPQSGMQISPASPRWRCRVKLLWMHIVNPAGFRQNLQYKPCWMCAVHSDSHSGVASIFKLRRRDATLMNPTRMSHCELQRADKNLSYRERRIRGTRQEQFGSTTTGDERRVQTGEPRIDPAHARIARVRKCFMYTGKRAQ